MRTARWHGMAASAAPLRAGALCAALAIAAVGSAGAAATASAAKRDGKIAAESLYVLSARSGELDRTSKGGTFRLLIRDPQGDVTSFTDRPARRAGQMKVGSFIKRWDGLGFKRVPPNAALVIGAAPDSRDVLVVELSKPDLLPGDRLAFRAEVLKGSATGALSRFGKRADRRVAAEFGEFSLFIDPSGEPHAISFHLTNVSGLQGFAMSFRNATLSGIGHSLDVSGAAEMFWTGAGFRINPRVVSFPSPGDPIDADIDVFVDAQSRLLGGRTELPSGAAGTMTVQFTDAKGVDGSYRVPIGAGFSDFGYPLDGRIPPNATPAG